MIVALLWGMTIADRVCAVAVFAATGAGIWKDIAGRERPRWLAILRERRGYRDEQEFLRAADFRNDMAAKRGATPDRNRAACFVFAPDLPGFEETDDERTMRTFCELARNGEGVPSLCAADGPAPGGRPRPAVSRTGL